MIFLHDRNGIIKTADTLKRNKRRTEKTEILKSWARDRRKTENKILCF